MDTLLKTAFEGRNISELVPELPPGNVWVNEEYLESQPLRPDDRDNACYFLPEY